MYFHKSEWYLDDWSTEEQSKARNIGKFSSDNYVNWGIGEKPLSTRSKEISASDAEKYWKEDVSKKFDELRLVGKVNNDAFDLYSANFKGVDCVLIVPHDFADVEKKGYIPQYFDCDCGVSVLADYSKFSKVTGIDDLTEFKTKQFSVPTIKFGTEQFSNAMEVIRSYK